MFLCVIKKEKCGRKVGGSKEVEKVAGFKVKIEDGYEFYGRKLRGIGWIVGQRVWGWGGLRVLSFDEIARKEESEERRQK